MMIARRRASATHALRMFERLAMAKAQSISFNSPLYRVSMTMDLMMPKAGSTVGFSLGICVLPARFEVFP